MAHRDNGGPAAGVGFAGGLGLRLQECNLCVSRMARRTRARRLIAAAGGRPRGGVEIEAAVGQEKPEKKESTRAGSCHYPGFRGSLLGETAHGSRPCRWSRLARRSKMSGPLLWVSSSLAGNSEVG